MKRCTLCLELKPLSEFPRQYGPHRRQTSKRSRCEDCERARNTAQKAEARIPAKTSAELLDTMNASASERMLVLRLVAEIARFQKERERRLRKRIKRPRFWKPKPKNEPKVSRCEIMCAGIDWRRQTKLWSAAIAMAKEKGVVFVTGLNGGLASSIRKEQSA